MTVTKSFFRGEMAAEVSSLTWTQSPWLMLWLFEFVCNLQAETAGRTWTGVHSVREVLLGFTGTSISLDAAADWMSDVISARSSPSGRQRGGCDGRIDCKGQKDNSETWPDEFYSIDRSSLHSHPSFRSNKMNAVEWKSDNTGDQGERKTEQKEPETL